jgi:hypothetical protein
MAPEYLLWLPRATPGSDGIIDCDNVLRILSFFGFDATVEQAHQYATRFDRNAIGQLDFQDFCLFWGYLQYHDGPRAPPVPARALDEITAFGKFSGATVRPWSLPRQPCRCLAFRPG